MTRHWDPATSIAKILSSVHEDTGLSDEAFSELINALDVAVREKFQRVHANGHV